ncbi:unnamed protein product [Vitrella brassicaformis CCMP3155]|uniref:Uncharacterized protein n=1 Tax=Vitrella brassicaformis (strain CCMP3155) TaxID=1169540 RepID=A0A0G4G5Z3_VITBC|nr:unnamed protein product [Vitrella brassicaformis CCMP3155]|eukprot:CEM23923.1 unnamed protein product [Vitrella brassicaformis CCMP3155]
MKEKEKKKEEEKFNRDPKGKHKWCPEMEEKLMKELEEKDADTTAKKDACMADLVTTDDWAKLCADAGNPGPVCKTACKRRLTFIKKHLADYEWAHDILGKIDAKGLRSRTFNAKNEVTASVKTEEEDKVDGDVDNMERLATDTTVDTSPLNRSTDGTVPLDITRQSKSSSGASVAEEVKPATDDGNVVEMSLQSLALEDVVDTGAAQALSRFGRQQRKKQLGTDEVDPFTAPIVATTPAVKMAKKPRAVRRRQPSKPPRSSKRSVPMASERPSKLEPLEMQPRRYERSDNDSDSDEDAYFGRQSHKRTDTFDEAELVMMQLAPDTLLPKTASAKPSKFEMAKTDQKERGESAIGGQQAHRSPPRVIQLGASFDPPKDGKSYVFPDENEWGRFEERRYDKDNNCLYKGRRFNRFDPDDFIELTKIFDRRCSKKTGGESDAADQPAGGHKGPPSWAKLQATLNENEKKRRRPWEGDDSFHPRVGVHPHAHGLGCGLRISRPNQEFLFGLEDKQRGFCNHGSISLQDGGGADTLEPPAKKSRTATSAAFMSSYSGSSLGRKESILSQDDDPLMGDGGSKGSTWEPHPWLSQEPLVRNWNLDPDHPDNRPLPPEMRLDLEARAREIRESQMRYADAIAAGSLDWGDENNKMMVTCGAEGAAAAGDSASGRMEIEL